MPTIYLETLIQAPVERVFDLARSIDAHVDSTRTTREQAVAGRTTGLLGLGEQVTWEARHLGIRQRLTVEMTAFERPHTFEDTMVRGAFKSMRHVHRFTAVGGATRMIDTFTFTAPLGPLGWIAERVFLTRYLRRFLIDRNRALKDLAESDRWRQYLTSGITG